MEVSTALEELLHVAFSLRLGEADVGILKQAGQIMVHVRSDHEHAWFLARALRSLNGHLFKFEDVDVVELFEEFDLPEGGYGKAVFFIVHQNLLHGDQVALLLRSCLGYFSKGAFSKFTQIFVVYNPRAAMESWPSIIKLLETSLGRVCVARHGDGKEGW